MYVMDDIRSLEATVSSQAREAEELVRSWEDTPSVNMEKRCLDVEVSATLKEWREDTAAELVWEIENGGSGSGSVPATERGPLQLRWSCLWTSFGRTTACTQSSGTARPGIGNPWAFWAARGSFCRSNARLRRGGPRRST